MTSRVKPRLIGLLAIALAWAIASGASRAQTEIPRQSDAAFPSEPGEPDRVATRFALMRNGVVWEGEIVDQGDSYTIKLPGGGALSASKLDAVFVGDSREDVFAFKVKETRLEDVNEVLKLADWADRRQLGGAAIKLLTTLLERSVDDAERRALQKKIDELTTAEKFRANAARSVAALEERRREASGAATNFSASKNVKSQEDAELDAWGRTLPAGVLELFGRKALPALQKRCATSGCHAPGTLGTRYSARPKAIGPAQRLALLYTLRETIAYVDFENVEASPILNHPTVTDVRGERVYPFGTDRYSARDCANFVEWLETANHDPTLAAAAKEYRARRDSEPTLRPGAASRYDVLDATRNESGVSSGSAGSENQGFAELFDESPNASRAAANPDLGVAPVDPSAPIFQQGRPRDSERFAPSPFDDVNSTESVLSRVGMASRKTYRDEYDPAIFNDRFHASEPRDVAPTDQTNPAGPTNPSAVLDITANDVPADE